MRKVLLSVLLIALSVAPGRGQVSKTSKPGETLAEHDARMAWWRDAKFGMFVHWGLYAIPADGEWHMRQHHESIAEYSKLASQFNPTAFDADAWMSVAHDAGMGYIVVTSKHHDGFAMFHSAASPYNVFDATPFHRDVIGELAGAAPKHGIRMGVYYSATADWGHPGGGAGEPHWDKAQDGSYDDYIKSVATPQVKELLTKYGPISELWFDNDGTTGMTAARSKPIFDLLKLQPQVIVDPRLAGVPGDFETVEGSLGVFGPQGDWEYCTTVNGSWGYSHKPAKALSVLLPDVVTAWSLGGNVLLNVGPDATGVIPEGSAAVLRSIGDWLKVNGEAIHGSVAGPFEWLPWGQATRKGNKLYLHVWAWPADGILRVPLKSQVVSASLLADAGHRPLSLTREGDTLLVHVPKQAPDAVVSVIALLIHGEPSRYESLTRNRPVTVTSEPKDAKNIVDDKTSYWKTTESTATVEVDLGRAATFNRVRLAYNVVKLKHVVFEGWNGSEWKQFAEATNDKGIARTFEQDVTPVTASKVRVRVLDSEGGIRVADFSVFPVF